MSHTLKQTFIKITRQVSSIEQLFIEEEYDLFLYETKVVSPTQTFQLKDILDVSYRKTPNNKIGTLYLHTTQGVFPFCVRDNPEVFIDALKEKASQLKA